MLKTREMEENLLYPRNVQIHHVSIIHRHGERAPIHTHFANSSDWQDQCHQTTSLFYQFALSTGLNAHLSSKEPPYSSSPAYYLLQHLHTHKNQLAIGPNACYVGELTDKGKQTMYELGQRLRRIYIDQLHLIDDHWTDSTSLMARTTEVPRAIFSLQALLYGMYPITKRTNSTSVSPSIKIYAMQEKHETMYSTSQCARWVFLEKQARLRMRHLFNEERKKLRTESPLKVLFGDDGSPEASTSYHEKKPSLHSVYDDLICRKAHGLPLPEGIDEPLLKRLEHMVAQEWFGAYPDQPELCRLAIGRFLDQLLKPILNSVHDHEPTMAIYSGHDSTIAPLLAIWQLFDGTWPPFGSHIAVEVARDPKHSKESLSSSSNLYPGWFVRLLYQNQPVRLPNCQQAIAAIRPLLETPFNDGTFCPLSKFVEMTQAFIPLQFDRECHQKET